MSVVTADEKGCADRAPAASQLIVSQPETLPTTGLALLPRQRLYSSPGILAIHFSGVDTQMSIMNRQPTDQEKKPPLPLRVNRNTCGQQLVPSRLTSRSPVRRQGGGSSCPGALGS
jgi:hypothetical protein